MVLTSALGWPLLDIGRPIARQLSPLGAVSIHPESTSSTNHSSISFRPSYSALATKKQSIDLSRICNPMKNHATLSSNNLYSWNDITRRIFQLRLSNANLIKKPCNNIEVNNDSMSIPFMIRYYLSLYKASTIHIIFQRQQCGNLHWNGPFTGQEIKCSSLGWFRKLHSQCALFLVYVSKASQLG